MSGQSYHRNLDVRVGEEHQKFNAAFLGVATFGPNNFANAKPPMGLSISPSRISVKHLTYCIGNDLPEGRGSFEKVAWRLIGKNDRGLILC